MSNIDPVTLYLHCTVNTRMHTCRGTQTHTHFHSLTYTLSLTMDLVDLRVLRQNLISQFLCGRQHFGVMDWNQILNELLQLVSAHLEQGFWDGQVQFDLLGLPYSVKWQCHYMGAVEDVFVAAGACYRRDLAAVEADTDAANELWGRGCGRVRHCAAEMETWKRERFFFFKKELFK